MFCAPGPVFGRIETSGPVIKFCALGPILGGTDGVESRFHVLLS
jgi:hypothetical protein